jgi:hypothetical protein
MWYEGDVRVALVIAAGTACGGGDGRRAESALERDVRAAVTAAIGEPVTSVACTATSCRVVVGGGPVDVPVVVRSDGSATTWAIDGLVVGGAKLEAHVVELLAEIGVVGGRADCGPRVIVARAGDRVTCALSPPLDGGRAWATMRDDGTADVEIALDAGIAAERTRDVDENELDALSRALDRDDAGGEDDGDEAAPPPGTDAGGP